MYREFRKSLCTYKRCWKWCLWASIQAWTRFILFASTFCRSTCEMFLMYAVIAVFNSLSVRGRSRYTAAWCTATFRTLIIVRHFIGKYLVTSVLYYLIKYRANIIRRYPVWYVQSVLTQCIYIYNTRWFKYDRDWFVQTYTQTVPVIFNPYLTAFPYGNGMVLHFYQQQESSTTKTVHKVIDKRLKTYV